MTLIKILTLLCSIVACALCNKNGFATRQFPNDFLFGVATASYQVEGGWNASGKGENIWDRLAHEKPEVIQDRSSGDVACDSYHQHKRDVEMLQELNVDYYRLSLSWSRLLPNGFADEINEDGVRYYNELFDDLLAANITPFVTIYHWDLPQRMQDVGGWMNPYIVDYYADYAEFVFKTFGDRVKTWLTFNEPKVVCVQGYGGNTKAPVLDMGGIGDYICAHNLLKAHAKAYHMYDEVFKPNQKGRVGWTLNADWHEPETDSAADQEASETSLQFHLGWYAHPVFSDEGDYPKVMKDIINERSLKQGYAKSRLPEFTPEEVEYLKGTYDYFGLNHYSSLVSKMPTETENITEMSFDADLGMINYQDPSWPTSASSWIRVVPWGFTKLLNWIKNEYNNPEVIVFENGFTDRDGMEDVDRINYYHLYLNALLDALEDGCNVSAYTAWSLLDNFEWNKGYTERFGLYYVNFTDPMRTRTPKLSAAYFTNIVTTKTIESVEKGRI